MAVLVVVLALWAGLTGCQVKVAVDTKVAKDGSGTVAVGVGLDDQALARFGELNGQVKLDDLAAAGWTVTKAQKEPDGLTWLRAMKPFANVAELNAVMAEVAQANTMFRSYTFDTVEDSSEITYRVKGTVDATKGVDQFSDAELAAKLNNDAFGGWIPAIEAAEGRPVADMVTFDITTTVADGIPQTVHPTLRDTAPTPIDVATVEAKPPPSVVGIALVVLVVAAVGAVIVMLVGARRRFRHHA